MALELVKLILEKEFVNFAEFVSYVLCNFDKEYFGVIKTNSGLFERLCKGNYLEGVFGSSMSLLRALGLIFLSRVLVS